jgi:hypothetical protein
MASETKTATRLSSSMRGMRTTAEGGLAFDASGQAFGMTVFGPRRRVLVIPTATITRVATKVENNRGPCFWGTDMSVLVEAITVIVRAENLNRRYPGGLAALAAAAPNQTFRSDGQLAAIGFVTPSDVDVYIISLEEVGIRFVAKGRSRDIVVIDQINDPTTPCDWIEAATEPDGDARLLCHQHFQRGSGTLRYR